MTTRGDRRAGGAGACALITQKAPGVIFGLDAAEAVVQRARPRRALERLAAGGRVARGGGAGARDRAARAAALLTAERTALNFLAHLSGVATMAARAARAVEGTGARVLDTRKTTPGLRALEKAAVAAGGGDQPPRRPLRRDPDQGEPHRGAGGIAAAVERAREAAPELAATLEVEVRDPGEIDEALAAGRRGCCSTTWTRRNCARPSRRSRPRRARGERRGQPADAPGGRGAPG